MIGLAAAAAVSLVAHLDPVDPAAFADYMAALAPPYLVVDVEAAAYRTDPDNWNWDNWVVRPDVLAARGGDCEDMAIAVVHGWRAAGVPADQAFVAIGFATAAGGVHLGVHAVAVRWHDGSDGGPVGAAYVDPTGITGDRSGGRFEPWVYLNERGAWRRPGAPIAADGNRSY